MNGENLPLHEAARDQNIETGQSIQVKEFILQSLTADLQKEVEALPGRYREKGLILIKQFQQNFIELINKQVQDMIITDTQASFLRTALISSLSFDFKRADAEVIMYRNAKDLLIAATYINSLDSKR